MIDEPITLRGVDYYYVSGPLVVDGTYTVTELANMSPLKLSRYSLVNRLANLQAGRGVLISVYEAITVPTKYLNVDHDPGVLAAFLKKEREFIERYHFEGESYCRIAEAMGMRMAMIDGLHRRATIKLKKLLAAFMADEFNLKVEAGPECPICISQYRDEIDRLIASKQKEETWRPIIQKLKKEYGIVIKTPQILIGHQKYHQSNVEKEKK